MEDLRQTNIREQRGKAKATILGFGYRNVFESQRTYHKRDVKSCTSDDQLKKEKYLPSVMLHLVKATAINKFALKRCLHGETEDVTIVSCFKIQKFKFCR